MPLDPLSGRSHRPGLFPNGNPRPGADLWAVGYEGDGDERRGRDPRTMTQDDLRSLGHGEPILAAVKTNCLECQGGGEGASGEVRRCRIVWCPFWPYRMGSNPFHTRQLTDEQRAKAADRLRALHEAKRRQDG